MNSIGMINVCDILLSSSPLILETFGLCNQQQPDTFALPVFARMKCNENKRKAKIENYVEDVVPSTWTVTLKAIFDLVDALYR